LLTENLVKEELSYAYVHAIASRARFECNHGPRHDLDSIDATISARGRLANSSLISSPRIELQLKSTSGISLLDTDDYFSFDVPIKNYNDLRQRRAIPAYFVVFIMPADETQWLTQTEESLITRHCAYWRSLLNAPEVTNTETKRIRIPRTNLLTVEALRNLMVLASQLEEVTYVE